MPGADEGAPDEIESILDAQAEQDLSAGDDVSTAESDQSAQFREPAQSHGASEKSAGTKQQAVDWKARFTSLKKQYDPAAEEHARKDPVRSGAPANRQNESASCRRAREGGHCQSRGGG